MPKIIITLLVILTAQITQAQIHFKIIIPSFCSLSTESPKWEQIYYHNLYINLGPISYVCNNHSGSVVQINSTQESSPTRLILSTDVNCFDLRNTIRSDFKNQTHLIYLCAPANYSPKPNEATITVTSP